MVFGFQIRSPKTSLIGCKALNPKGKGIYIFGNSAGRSGSNCNISGCTIDTCKQYNATGGYAIYLDPSMTGVNISGCTFKDCEGNAVTGAGPSNDDIVFTGNTVKNCSTITNNGNIFLNGSHVVVSGNRFVSGPNRPVKLASSADSWTIEGNDFTGMGNAAPALLTSTFGSMVKGNIGHNPIGVITNAFRIRPDIYIARA